MTRAWLPPGLLAAYALAFGARALGGGVLVFDDHPGQLYRLVHAITLGPTPWRLDPGWWAGYAELQYYPPGFAWLGALLHAVALGALAPESIYWALLWLVWVLPGAATYALLRRLSGDPWLALPGAFVALTLSAGCRSGVEEGLRWGLVAARLGWATLPLLAASLLDWAAGRGRPPWSASALVAAVTLLHPAHVPTAVLLVLLAALHRAPRPVRLREAALVLLLGAGLAAVWLVPLLAHLDMALPLAWHDPSLAALGRRLLSEPVLLALALLSWAAWRGAAPRWLLAVIPAQIVCVALDALVARPLGAAWLPADRLVDGLVWGLAVGGGLGLSVLARAWARPALVVGLALAACVPLSWGAEEPGLSLWPWAGQWPKEPEVVRGLRLDRLWSQMRDAPPGRVLFLRSGVPLDWRPEWWRAHSHITALTPIRAGRAIVGGTFTHPSPVAGLVYTGSAAPRPITRLAEQRDGRTLFGRPLESLDAASFNRLAARLGISVIVALDEDWRTAPFLTENPEVERRSRIGPFMVFFAPVRNLPVRVGPQRWRMDTTGRGPGWQPLPVAYSPLWVARAGGAALPARRDDLGLLEVALPAGAPTVELAHRPGLAEWSGTTLTALSAAGLGLAGLRRSRG